MTEPVIPGAEPQPTGGDEPPVQRVVVEPQITGSTEGEGDALLPDPTPSEQPAGEGSPAIPPVSGEPTPQPAAPPAWATQRIAQLAEQRRQAQADLQAAQSELARLRSGGEPQPGTPAPLVPLDFEAAVTARAAEIQFNRECSTVYGKGAEQYKDWDAQLKNFGLLGGLTPQFLEAAMEQDAPQEVLYALAQNPDEASRILQLSGARLGVAMAKFAVKQATPATKPTGPSQAAPAAKPVTNAPDPIVPRVGGTNPTRAVRLDDETVDMGAWVKARNAQLKRPA